MMSVMCVWSSGFFFFPTAPHTNSEKYIITNAFPNILQKSQRKSFITGDQLFS